MAKDSRFSRRELLCLAVKSLPALVPWEELDQVSALSEISAWGIARIERGSCLAWNGMLCQECYYACPQAGKAIYLEAGQRPVVQEAQCDGCGRCQDRCMQNPPAIKVATRAGNSVFSSKEGN